MGRKGGGRKGFMKAVARKGGEDDGVDVQNTETQASSDAQVTVKARKTESKADMFRSDPVEKQADPLKQQVAPKQAENMFLKDDSDTEESSKTESRGQVQQRHKREAKQLKEKIKKLGKKGKDEAERLEAELEQRHARELEEVDAREAGSSGGATDATAQSLYAMTLGDSEAKKPSRSQKRNEKRRQQEIDREARIAAEQAELGDSERVLEERALREMLLPLGLTVVDIQADGHCLYRALEHQLKMENPYAVDFLGLRKQVAGYFRAHKDEFKPLILAEMAAEDAGGASHDTDDDDEEEEEDAGEGEGRQDAMFERYCKNVESTAEWGGQMELQALAASLKRPLVVYCVGMPVLELGEEFKDRTAPLRVAYQRHAFGLGEHYNSVVDVEVLLKGIAGS